MVIDPRYFLPARLPADWTLLTRCTDGAGFLRSDGLLVISSAVVDSAGDPWLHVSCSCDTSPPSLLQLQEIKRLFVGRRRIAFQIFPSDVSPPAGPLCFHLWTALDDRPFPDVLKPRPRS